MLRTAYEVQRDFALSSGLRSQIIWDSLATNQAEILQLKIATLFPADEANKPVVEKLRSELFNSIWQQRKYTNGVLLSAIIYVLVSEENDVSLAPDSKKYSCHPVFRTRKCLSDDNSAGCCMVFIDEQTRVYKNWAKFLENNMLPAGTMIAPANGVYSVNENDEVALECCATPNATKSRTIMRHTGMLATIGGLGATVPLAATLIMPVAAPITLAATAVAVTTSVYTGFTSAYNLIDRRKHAQPIGVNNCTARGNWLGVAGGLVGLGSTGATKVLSYAAARGKEVSLCTKLAVTGINNASLLITGTGVVNSLYSLYMTQSVTSDDVLQLASSLVVFTHTVNNIHIASKIIGKKNSTDGIVKEVHNQVRSVLRQMSIGIGNSSDLIRMVNMIPSGDVLSTLITTLATAGQLQGTQNLASISKYIPTLVITYNGNSYELNLTTLNGEFSNKFVQHIVNKRSLIDVLLTLGKHFSDRATQFLLNLTNTFINAMSEKFDRKLRTLISTEEVLYKMVMICIKKYKSLAYEVLEKHTIEIMNRVEGYFIMLDPNNSLNKKEMCKKCQGYYYLTPL